MELIIKSITPAFVDINIEDVKKYMQEVKDKYENIVFSSDEITTAKEERTILNKLDKDIFEARKKIEKEGMSSIKNIIDTLKQAEKDTKALSSNIGEQIKKFDEEEWENKKFEIKKIINRYSVRNEDIKEFVILKDEWKKKGISLKKIETEVQEQYEELNKKKDFINTELEKANAEIEFKMLFEAFKYLITYEYGDISRTIENKKNETKETEENLKRRAEEQKQKELAELEARKEREKQEAVAKATEETTAETKNENTDKKGTYICIKVNELSEDAANDLLTVIRKYNLKYIKKEVK